MKTTVAWDGNLAFGGLSPSGHEIKMDAGQEDGGVNSGPRPTELLLHAVAGCTGIDIILILKKMRLEPESFQMEIEGIRADEHPKRFTDVHIHYVLEGDLPEEKAVKAVKLSVDKYCSVAHSLNAEIKASCSINGKTVEGLDS